MEILLVLVAVAIAGVITVVVIKRQAAKIVSVEQDKPKTAAPKQASVQSDTSSKKTETPAVDKASEPAGTGRQTLEAASAVRQVEKQEKIPEDSALRRHYLSVRQAEREAITNPYPTDSTLRRHYESMSAIRLNSSLGKTEGPAQAQTVKHLALPEDSTLRRHFLTQVQAEIESITSPRPTDSALRRHYDSQVKAKMDEYLTEAVM